MGDYNKNLLNAETRNFTKEVLVTLQSYSFIPTIDKTTRVYSSSATLIAVIFLQIKIAEKSLVETSSLI